MRLRQCDDQSCYMKNWIKCTGAFYRDSVALCRPTAAAMDRDECNRLWTVSQASNPSKLLETIQEDKEKKNGQSIKEDNGEIADHCAR